MCGFIGIVFIMLLLFGNVIIKTIDVILLQMVMQLVISLRFIHFCPNTMFVYWLYLLTALVVLAFAYILFMKKYYHLHEAYLALLKKHGI